MEPNHSQKNEVVQMPKRSRESYQTVLALWLARFGEMYRQPTSEVSIQVYLEFLSELSPEELDAACRRAVQTSEFFPVVATILKAHQELRWTDAPPSTLIRYPEVSPEDRAISPETQKIMDDLKVRLGIGEFVKKPERVKIFTPTSAPLSFDEQKAELRRRGWLK